MTKPIDVVQQAFFSNGHFNGVQKVEEVSEVSAPKMDIQLDKVSCYGCKEKGWVKIMNGTRTEICPICRGNGALFAGNNGQIYSPMEIKGIEDLIEEIALLHDE